MMDESTLWIVAIGSGIASLVGVLAVWLGKVAVYDAAIQESFAKPDSTADIITQGGGRWYEQFGWLALALIIVWPVGYFGLLKTSRVSPLAKAMAITAVGLAAVYAVLHGEIRSLDAQISALQRRSEASSSTAQKAASDAREANRKFDEIFRKSMRE